MTSRPHATMKRNPPLQRAVHRVISEAMRIFCTDIESPILRRRAVMRVYITLYGGISLYAAGVLDQPSDDRLICGTRGDERAVVNTSRLDSAHSAHHC